MKLVLLFFWVLLLNEAEYPLCMCRCKKQKYPSNLPAASVVICFYNEDYNTLLRTVHSIMDRTPGSLLHEILLVDDNSDIGN
jgi:cellulose synthase/poly-beta-1,6-N-acetylglucosamine synthase-like glycosyltransferase